MNAEDEFTLARKLALHWQLNVTERNSLPPGGLAATAFVDAIREILSKSSRNPADWLPTANDYHGAVISASVLGYAIHVRHEIGVHRYSNAKITNAKTIEDAVRAFLEATFAENNIDGILIDWTR